MLGVNSPREPITPEFSREIRAALWRATTGNLTPSQGVCPRVSIVMGNEVKGVHQEVVDASDGCLEIPQLGTKHSMNVSVTAGIIIYKFAESLMLRK